MDLSAKPGTSLKLNSAAAITESQVWEPAEKEKCRLHSSKVEEMFVSLLAGEIHGCCRKKEKEK